MGQSDPTRRCTVTLLNESTWTGKIFSGGWADGAGGTYDIAEPATGGTLGRLGAAAPDDVTRAAAGAAEAQRAWVALPHTERAAVLRRAGQLFEEHAEEIQGWLVREAGSIPPKTQLETHVAAQECFEASSLPSHPLGRILASEEPRLSMARRTPVGGGVVIARVFEEAGLPEGLLAVLPGGADVGEALVADPLVRVISFTGSSRAGRAVGELAASHLKRAHLELGGNSALVVLDDADLDRAASAGAWGSFLHQGQICMASGRHLVHESLYDDYVARLAEKADQLPVGDPATSQVALGPVIDAGQRDKIHSLVTASVDAGARLAAGGTYEGLFYRPTVLADVERTAPVYAEEVFGPVAPVVRFSSLEEAAKLAAETDYGLALGILTRDVMQGLALAELIPTGIVHINDQTVSDEANIPFGGVGVSGTGSRFGGAEANLDAFTDTKWITVRGEIPAYPF